MLDIGTILLDAQWVEDKGFYIWCTNTDDHTLDINDWRDRAFAWHKPSFYGTFLEEVTIGRHDAVQLSPWMALDFFASIPENSLITFTLSDSVDGYRHAAKPMYQAIEDGHFMPDFHQWRQGEFGWKTNDDVFADDDFLKKWFSSAVNDWIQEDTHLLEAWNDIVKAFPLVTSTETDSFVDEYNWLELVGFEKDATPFQVLLRLDEPEEDSGIWKLETILRDKENHDDQMVWHGIIPPKWEQHADRVIRDHEMWCKIVPWLSDGYGIVQEITELQAWDFLMDDSQRLLNAGVEIQLPSWWQAIKDAQLAVKAKVKTSAATGGRQSFVGLKSIIDFDWRFSTNGVELSEDEFLQLVDQKRRLINIRGRWIKLDPAFMKQVQTILQKANKEGLHFRDVLEQELLQAEGNANDGLEEDNRAFAKIEIQLNRHLSNMIKQLTEITELPKVDVPASFKGELRPYQQHGVEWLLFLRRFGFGACLADDMGLGKTIQMIAYFLKVKEQGGKPALIICPTSVLGNWQKELEKFGPSLNVHLHYGSSRGKGEDFKDVVNGADVVLTSYGLSHLDFEELSSYEWGTICLDEAQNIKNAQTKQSRSIRKLNGEHHIALTGTPMENRLTELWSIYDFTNAGYLGSLGQFQKRYVAPIEKDRDTEKIAQVQKLIRPFLLRRTKLDKEVALNLPDKLEQKEYCPLTVEQASLYEQLVKDTFEQVEQLAGMQRKGLILKMLSKLKQVCDHPALYLKEATPKDILHRSSKMEKLRELVGDIREQNESCLIFTQYIFMGEMMQSLLEKEFGEKVLFLNGSIPKAQRDQMIEDFQDGKHSILILSLKAGGTGLNLTAANHVIHYDRWWNPAVENQATDRAYRIGQKRFVHVHKFISTGTLEEKIDEMLETKQSLNDEIIQSESWITELSTTDLKDLFTLR